jgi:hypothetical protein
MSALRACAAVVAAVMAAAWATAQDETTQAREILNKNREAVVTLRLVINQQISMPGMGSRKDESKVEVTGTVIDPSGLTLVSLSQTDPASVFRGMMGSRASQMQFESQVADAKIVRADGSEVDAKIVLRDKDLDFAFVRPKDPGATPWPHVDLTQASQPQVLDELVILARMGRIANRVYGASIDRVQALVERPRTFYIPVGVDPSGGLGAPAFTLDGKTVGVLLLRTMQADTGGMAGIQGSDSAVVIVVPAADIQEAAAQAPSYEEAAQQEEAEKAEAPEGEAAPGEGEAAPGEGEGQPGAEEAPTPAEPGAPAEPAEPAEPESPPAPASPPAPTAPGTV